MNVHEFLLLTQSSKRKFLNNSHTEKDLKIIQAGLKRLEVFFLFYQKKFHSHLSPEQRNLIITLAQLCQESLTPTSFKKLLSELQQYHSLGVNLLVRHPEPLLSSYRKEPGKNLSFRGMIQVWGFNKFLKGFLEMYEYVNIKLYTSDSKRTGIFADLTYSYLSRNSHARLKTPRLNSALVGSGMKIKEMKERYPDLRKALDDGKILNNRKLKVLREYFKRWIAESPLSKATSNEIRDLMRVFSDNTINIYFSHENVIGSYLYHELNQDLDKALIRFAGFVISSKNYIHIAY